MDSSLSKWRPKSRTTVDGWMLDEPTWVEPSELAILARLERDPTQMASRSCQHSVLQTTGLAPRVDVVSAAWQARAQCVGVIGSAARVFGITQWNLLKQTRSYAHFDAYIAQDSYRNPRPLAAGLCDWYQRLSLSTCSLSAQKLKTIRIRKCWNLIGTFVMCYDESYRSDYVLATFDLDLWSWEPKLLTRIRGPCSKWTKIVYR